MSNIKVTIAGRDIKVADGYEKPSAGDVNTCQVFFAIESGGVWDDLPRKRVTFSTRTASVTVDYAPTIIIPHEVMASPGALYLTLTGYDADGIEVARTHRMTYPIEVAKAGADEGAEPSPATLDVVSRIDSLASTLEASETTRQEAFDSAQNERRDAFQASMNEWQQDVAESVSHASNAATLANEAATNANNATSNANEAAESANSATSEAHNAANELREAAERGDFDGAPGAPGEPGADGYSPTANVTKVGGTATITVTDKNGTTTATVSDGEPGAPGSDANVTKENVEAALGYEPLRGLSIAGAEVTPIGGFANIPLSNGKRPGVIMTDDSNGGYSTGLITVENRLWLRNAGNSKISGRTMRVPILANNMDYAVKAAMCDGNGAAWTADEQKAARERMNAADSDKVYIMQKQIENLQGIAATEENDSTEAYTKTVPTGAQKWASLDKVGGKTVVWNQLVKPSSDHYVASGVTFNGNNDGTITINGTASDSFSIFELPFNAVSGHKYIVLGSSDKAKVTNSINYSTDETYIVTSNSTDKRCLLIYGTSGTVYNNFIIRPQLFDLTAMFGSGNEPSTVEEFRAMFPADYYPYNPGELMSAEVVEVESKGTFPIPDEVREMCPGYGWSAGTVCNEIDFKRKVYVQRVGSVDLGTLNWTLFYEKDFFYADFETGYEFSTTEKNVPCSKYVGARGQYMYEGTADKCIAVNDEFLHGAIERIYIRDTSYTDVAAFKMSLQGVMLYYELATPIEVDLSNVLPDDHFIEVEAGGTVTFKQAATQLPVPSSVTYQISTSEVIANA